MPSENTCWVFFSYLMFLIDLRVIVNITSFNMSAQPLHSAHLDGIQELSHNKMCSKKEL